MQLDTLIYKMLTENTGRAICDSGGENGRHWQRNKLRTIDDFRSDAPCTLEISKYELKYTYKPATDDSA